MRKSYHERLVEKNRQEIKENKENKKRFYIILYSTLFVDFCVMASFLYLMGSSGKNTLGMLLLLTLWDFQSGALSLYVLINALADRDFDNDAEIFWKKTIEQTVAYDEDFLRKHRTGSALQTRGKSI